MKKYIKCGIIVVFLGFTSCVSDLLDQTSTTELDSRAYWKSEEDATTAFQGACASVRKVFDRDYYFDGHGEYARVRGRSGGTGSYSPSDYGRGFDTYYQWCYGAVNHLNYVIDNVTLMLEKASATSKPKLETIIGEARLLRGMVYFRLISMWGDVVYLEHIVKSNSEVESITRTPIQEVKNKIEEDFTYAIEKLPNRAAQKGRASKWAAYGFRGKLNLYWACWNRTSWPWTTKGGWPELKGFNPSDSESQEAYKKATADFEKIIDESGLNLFRNGEPGECSPLGAAELLPNYYYLFVPIANNDDELIMAFTHGGIGTGQGEELMRDFATRTVEGSQGWCQPRAEIINRFQSTETGDFCEPLIPMNPIDPEARTKENSTLNPKSYANRDFRMKSILLWDDEVMMGMLTRQDKGFKRYRFKQLTGTIDGLGAINADGDDVGYISRKFIRNKAGLARSEGNYSFPVLRLADVYLMYAEASNEVYGPTAKAIDVVNKIRHRGNLPVLKAEKTVDKLSFFNAIEQERIIELFFEGFRGFDLRRWRMMEKIWGPPFGEGVRMYDTHGGERAHYFNNASDLTYDRLYIFAIPESERNRNPNLTQNTPWL